MKDEDRKRKKFLYCSSCGWKCEIALETEDLKELRQAKPRPQTEEAEEDDSVESEDDQEEEEEDFYIIGLDE